MAKAKTKHLSAEEIFAAEDCERDEVFVPEWHGTVTLRAMTAEEAIDFEEGNNTPARKNAMVRMIQICAIHGETGAPLFTLKDLERLKQKSVKPLLLLQERAMTLNQQETSVVQRVHQAVVRRLKAAAEDAPDAVAERLLAVAETFAPVQEQVKNASGEAGISASPTGRRKN